MTLKKLQKPQLAFEFFFLKAASKAFTFFVVLGGAAISGKSHQTQENVGFHSIITCRRLHGNVHILSSKVIAFTSGTCQQITLNMLDNI